MTSSAAWSRDRWRFTFGQMEIHIWASPLLTPNMSHSQGVNALYITGIRISADQNQCCHKIEKLLTYSCGYACRIACPWQWMLYVEISGVSNGSCSSSRWSIWRVFFFYLFIIIIINIIILFYFIFLCTVNVQSSGENLMGPSKTQGRWLVCINRI